ncbi:Uncharacterised protein [Bordetella pertussis]|nr:Uncharacterised protein [Bordetella pertussis]
MRLSVTSRYLVAATRAARMRSKSPGMASDAVLAPWP